jgi:hypothetical protein
MTTSIASLSWLLPLGLLACNPGHLSTTAGDFGVAFDTEPDCIEIDASYLELNAPFTVDLFIQAGDQADFGLYPLVVWPGAFALFQNEYQYLIFGPTSDTSASAGASSPTDILDGGYHHVAATFSADGEAVVFLDGQRLASAPPALLEAPGDTLYLGCWPGQSNAYFSGTIGEVRIMNTQHYSGDFAPTWTEHEASETVLALWHLNEGRGTSVLDEMGNADGELEGGAWVAFPMPGYDPDEAPADTGGDGTVE